MKKLNIKIELGDYGKEMNRLQAALLPREMNDRNEKRLSKYQFQKRCELRTHIQHLINKIEAKGYSVEDIIDMVEGMPVKEQGRRPPRQANIQFPI